MFMLSSFLAGLRGEEVPLLSLEGMLKHWAEAAASRLPHLVLALLGRFKGEEGERWHMLPIGSDALELPDEEVDGARAAAAYGRRAEPRMVLPTIEWSTGQAPRL